MEIKLRTKGEINKWRKGGMEKERDGQEKIRRKKEMEKEKDKERK